MTGIDQLADRAEALKDAARALSEDAAVIVRRNTGDDAMHQTEAALAALHSAAAFLDDAMRRFVQAGMA